MLETNVPYPHQAKIPIHGIKSGMRAKGLSRILRRRISVNIRTSPMKLPRATALLLALLLHLHFTTAATEQSSLDEKAALLAFKEAATALKWNQSANICSWEGVFCATVDAGPVVGLNLSSRHLMGDIPDLGSLRHLQSLDLSSNNFTGVLPDSLGSLNSLRILNISENLYLTGPIPSELRKLSNLRALNLNKNNLTGPIPSELATLRNLVYLNLAGNEQLEGALPLELGHLTNLRTLELNNCSFVGNIPPTLGRLKQLKKLVLKYTKLSGEVPPSLGDLSELVELDLSFNRFSGPVPPQLANLKNLEVLKLHQNNFSGPFPPEFGALSSIQRIYLAHNNLGGTIPPTIGNLTTLAQLHIDECGLSGPLPSWLGDLPRFEVIKARKNNLSGEIPPALAKLKKFNHLDVEHNYLNGTVPHFDRLQVKKVKVDYNCLTQVVTQRTTTECSDFYHGARTSQDTSVNAEANNWRLFVGIFVPLGFVIVLLAAVATWCVFCRRRSDISEKFDGLKEHSYAELEAATARFNKSHLLGSGASADVYLGHLRGSDIAVKLLRPGNSLAQSDRSFRREVLGLGLLRHVNVVRLLGYSAERDRNKALVYEFAPMGTLKALLYDSSGQLPKQKLSFAQRMDIALQIARGILYCHHLIRKPMIHRDIKPANILMARDEAGNWVPKIADFGLATSVKSVAVNGHLPRRSEKKREGVLLTGDYSLSTSTLTIDTASANTRVAGTLGYIDPEYHMTSKPTLKSDVYSYGMLLLELLLGRTPAQIAQLNEGLPTSSWLKGLLSGGQQCVVETVEQNLEQPVTDRAKCVRAVATASQCLMEQGSERPTMRDVVRWLDDGGVLELPGIASIYGRQET